VYQEVSVLYDGRIEATPVSPRRGPIWINSDDTTDRGTHIRLSDTDQHVWVLVEWDGSNWALNVLEKRERMSLVRGGGERETPKLHNRYALPVGKSTLRLDHTVLQFSCSKYLSRWDRFRRWLKNF
jgi:hypothetical protein